MIIKCNFPTHFNTYIATMAFWIRMQLAEGCNHHRLAITRHSFSSRMNNCWIATVAAAAATAHNSSTSIQWLINIITQCTTFHNENNQNTRGTGQAGWIVSAAFALYNLIKFVYTRVYYKLYLFSVFHFVVYSVIANLSCPPTSKLHNRSLVGNYFVLFFMYWTNETITIQLVCVNVMRVWGSQAFFPFIFIFSLSLCECFFSVCECSFGAFCMDFFVFHRQSVRVYLLLSMTYFLTLKSSK